MILLIIFEKYIKFLCFTNCKHTCTEFFVSGIVSASSSLFITNDAGLLMDLSKKGFPAFSVVVVTIHV